MDLKSSSPAEQSARARVQKVLEVVWDAGFWAPNEDASTRYAARARDLAAQADVIADIVHRVDSHDALVSALKRLRSRFDAAASNYGFVAIADLDEVDAVLAKAEGKMERHR